jgi:hypothetical protein
MSEEKAGLATGIHAVAAAVACSKSATAAEIALAGEILKRAPKRELPREIESPIEVFNRQMDTAIESCNRSSGEPTRAARRARLASDLEREGLVLIEQSTLAELLDRTLAGEPSIEPFPDEDDGLEDDGEELGAELLTDEEAAELVERINSNPNLHPSSSGGILGLEYSSAEGVEFLTHTPSFELGVQHGSTAGAATTSDWIGDVGRDPLPTAVND